MINAEKKTVELWELHELVPAAKSIKKICDLFEIPLEYFGEYYSLYFNNPEKLFLKWKEENCYSFYECVKILESSKSALLSFTNGRFGLSYDMYLKMKKVGIF
ncbi:MAG TPA: hypothetical protein VF839_11405 [Clostridium sp.]